MASKKEQALALYKEMAAASSDGSVVRKAFIDRAVKELGMTAAGASTYYSNSKTTASGGTVPTYYVPADTKKVTQAVDDSKANAPLWSLVVVANDAVDSAHSFMSERGAVDRWNALKPTAQARCIVVVGAPEEGAPVSGLVKVDTAVS